jgi:arylsulfatase A-like enzyme
MTGRYPHSVGITRISPYQHFEDQLVLLAELLRNQGYYTEAVVSNGHVGKTANADQGFEVFAETGGPARQTNQLASRALRRLDRAVTRGRPFFLWLHYLDPHVPYKPPRYRGLFLGDPFYDAGSMIPVGDEPGERIPTASGDARLSHYERQRRAEINEQNLGSAPSRLVDERTEELAHYVAMYDAEIRYLDEYLQALFSELRGKGLLNHSAVVLTADHGESLGEHDYYFCQGRFPYNTTLRVPLLINDSSRGAKEVSSLASLLDVTPTILDLVGIESPSNLDGRTLLPVIDGEELEPRDLFAEAGYAIEYQKILVRDDWKLVYVPDSLDRSLMRGDEFELYNLAEDPMEATDLSNKCPEIVEEMKPSLLAWINSWRGRELTPAKPNLQYSEEELENLRALGYIK